MTRSLPAPLLVLSLLAPRVALADPPAGQGVVVRGDRVARERERVEDSPRFATSIDVRERGRTGESVAALLDEAPGLHTRSTGDGLSPTAVSLRGAPASHVTVALDGVVLNDATSEGLDISLVPPALLERADVYRGTAPVRLGVAGLGGAIELVTRAPGPRPLAWVTAGYGSFHQRRASVGVAGRAGPFRALLSVAYRGTQGDFGFYHDNGTPLVAGDDHEAVRVNNAGDALDVLFRGCTRGGACLLLVAGARERGMPGPGSRQFAHSALAQARFLGRASYRATVGTGWIEGYASLLARRDHFRDYSATVVPGLVIDARSVGTSVEAGALGVLGGSGLRVEPVVRGRYEWFDTAGAVEGRLLARRAGLLAGAEVSVTRGPLELVPALAVEAMRDEASGARMDTTRLLVSPRLGARVALGGGVEVRANLARMQRAPTLPELFGVATYLLGNDTLRPETSANADAGMVAVLPARGWDLRLEGSGFARRVEDLIVLVRSGVLSLKPLNLRDADVLGAEASVRASFRRAVALTASYAYTHALTRAPGTPADGLRVPSIPAHDLFARVEGTHGPLRAWMDLSYVSEIFFDEANLTPAPPRLLLSAAVALTLPFARAATLTAQGTNLLDQREAVVTITSGTRYDVHQPLADFAGYPLPGRALFLALTVATEPSP